MIGVIAKMKIKDGTHEQFEQVLEELAASVRRSEPGNTLYQLCRSRNDANRYVVLEMYESDDALDLHKSSEHMRKARPALAAVLAEPPDIEVFDAVPR